MNEQTKQRLVGVAVLVCIILIAVTLLLDGDGLPPSAQDLTVPSEPKLEVLILEEPMPPEKLVSEAAPDGESHDFETNNLVPFDTESGKPATNPNDQLLIPVAKDRVNGSNNINNNDFDQPTFDKQGLPEGWLIKMGIFQESQNADALLAKLMLNGESAFSRPSTLNGTPVTEVYVGPVISRAEANAMSARLGSEFKLKPSILSFTASKE